ncbi:T9SS type A sorting domain-containing protein [Neotamlana laminarinivorans]|uniref:M64 family metallo-endopeptidase n=1 Tax=Neotamlana laminarinivorans TaxID=2883124 RepID=A0A9X1HZU9_9FLAO|nr:M64 family metallopeptidase [Tamlana laminarinivorans]MCB4799208.1 M64 family metallo-endopeptidase [Tamlana laminarinivorans]
MKKVKFFIVLMLSSFLNAQVFDVETIKYSSDDNNRINLVILSEGYQESELANFISDAEKFTSTMFAEAPFSNYTNYFNVYAVKVPSNESGADRPSTNTYVDTYFNATHEAFGQPYLLYYEVDGYSANNTEAKILSVLADNTPNYDVGLILVNSPDYGGSGGSFPMAYNGYWGNNVIMHEIGHSLFDLKDEYYPGDELAAEAINMTKETNPAAVKWKNWINTNSVGIYQYTCDTGNCADWYKPHQNCIMEKIDKGFCSVCKEGMVAKIHELVSPIDSYLPNSNTIEATDFPIDFSLSLIKPDPNTLESTWTLNNDIFASNLDEISINETDLIEGENTLVTAITDNTSLIRIDNYETINIHTVTWSINYSTLGIETISSENNLSIKMYPNPTKNTINFSFENGNNSNLKIEIISLDGKRIKTLSLKNFETESVNISKLNAGVYLANFYSDNALLSTKKLIKL